MDATVNESGYTMTSTMRSENTENSFCARNIISWLDNNAEKIFLFIGLLVIIHAIFFQTVYRYIVINIFSGDANSVVWTEELSRFIFVWITYLAIPIVIKTTKDIRVTVVYDFFNDFQTQKQIRTSLYLQDIQIYRMQRIKHPRKTKYL